MAYVPPDPSQPLPEEPDTQDLEDEYANVRDALAAAAAAAVAAGANATMSLGQFEGGAADVGGGPRGIQGGAADSDVPKSQARRRSQGNREGTGENGGEGGGERRPDPQDERPQQRARVGVRGAQRAQLDSGDSVRELTVAMREMSDRQYQSETNAEAHRAQVASNMANTLVAGMNQIQQNQLTMQQNQTNNQMEMMRMLTESQERSLQLIADLVRGMQSQGQGGQGRQAKASGGSDEDEG